MTRDAETPQQGQEGTTPEQWPPDEWPDMSLEVGGKRHFWWENLTARQQEQVIHRGWTIHWMVGTEALNEQEGRQS